MDDDLFDRYEERESNTRELADDALEQQQVIDQEEEEHDPSRVCWKNLSDDDGRCKILCGFSVNDFLTLFDIVEDEIQENTGRGLRGKIPKEDKLLIVLCYLKHYETIDKMKDTFSISKSHLNRIINDTINAISPVLYECFVDRIDDHIPDDDPPPAIFPEAKYVMDATFQSIWTPTGTYNEKKRYYSGKHKAYGFKSQCFHDRKGRVLHCVPGVLGAVHDLTIARQSLPELQVFLQKQSSTTSSDESEDTWSILVDSGYQGLQHTTEVILPIKRRANRALTRQQRLFNRQLASERVICERFYGRMKGKFRIMTSKYRNSRDEYQTIFKLCVALTNFHLLEHPL